MLFYEIQILETYAALKCNPHIVHQDFYAMSFWFYTKVHVSDISVSLPTIPISVSFASFVISPFASWCHTVILCTVPLDLRGSGTLRTGNYFTALVVIKYRYLHYWQLDEDITEKLAEEQEYRKIRVRMRAEVGLQYYKCFRLAPPSSHLLNRQTATL